MILAKLMNLREEPVGRFGMLERVVEHCHASAWAAMLASETTTCPEKKDEFLYMALEATSNAIHHTDQVR
jgi:signal transduction histidine kinase